MQFEFVKQESWPQLSWVAVCQASADVIQVFHGPAVETSRDWFGEIIWDGDYGAADFDRTDIVSGSGARLRDGYVDFVSPGSTVDRLLVLHRSPDQLWVSNSLPGLLAKCSLSLVASYPYYIPEILSLVKGIRHCTQRLATTAEPVELVYFDNYRWDGCSGKRIAKPFPQRDFQSFAQYESFLRSCLEQLSRNLHDVRRSRPYSLITTISSGYDSPTVSALARDYGCNVAITFAQSRDGLDDSGAEIGRRLGLDTRSVDSDAWRSLPPNEAPFYAAAGMMGEIVFTGHAEVLRGSVLLTGYHGDGVWDLSTKYEGGELIRAGYGGLALSEYRLQAGFIHCPVAFFGARQIDQIHDMAAQLEMLPWSLQDTDYNRPICRRIVERAGVPREMFGTEKKAVGLSHFSRFYLSNDSRASYMSHLRQHQSEWFTDRRIPPIRNKLFDDVLNAAPRGLYNAGVAVVHLKRRRKAASRSAAAGLDHAPPSIRRDHAKPSSLAKRIQRLLSEPRNLHRYVVPWAVEECKRSYG
jgi:hypothetical protein